MESISERPEIENISKFDDPVFMAELREQMLKFAMIQLQEKSLAEDAVQDALVGALKNAKSFARRAAFKTWVFAILKNKIIDIHRQGQRVVNASSLTEDCCGSEANALFDVKGFWNDTQRPTTWAQPMEAVKNDHFWRVFDTCLNGLPEKLARLFMMREFLELDSDEICNTLEITTSNLHVQLHRARLQLRDCLDNKWFANEK